MGDEIHEKCVASPRSAVSGTAALRSEARCGAALRSFVSRFLCKTAFLCLVFFFAAFAPTAVHAAVKPDMGGNGAAFPAVYASAWALVPPVIAIALALATKEVYSSLFAGIAAGALLASGFQLEGAVFQLFEGGVLCVLSDRSNVGILIFLVILGAMVCLMNRAGGSAAFGEFAARKIKNRVGAQMATILLGVVIFIDDYFNCLTVGSVMRPVTDKFGISREKLAYLIDATAAPVCIIAPVSSWAAAVTGFMEGEDGFSVFIRAIPYNFYAILTIVMMVGMVLMKKEFGPMGRCERPAGETGGNGLRERGATAGDGETKAGNRPGIADLIIPILSLIFCCVTGMLYTGGFFSGTGFVSAFSHSDAPAGLAVGSFFALALTVLFYMVRRALSFKECMACIPEGFQAMVPAILILTFAWTLKAMTDRLGAAVFVAGVMETSAGKLMNFLPAIIFLVGCGLAFATGTSWGTFGILIPIAVAVFENSNPELMIISVSACMAGAVCGDHCSPISDTTIMAAAGARCEHMSHVSTQLPYALTAAAVSFVTYLAAGFTQSAWISLPAGLLMMAAVLWVIKRRP